MIVSVGTIIELGADTGDGAGGYRRDFPLERNLDWPIVVDATKLGHSHPMFLVRLRLFVDWHLAAGHEISVRPPTTEAGAQQWADMRMSENWPASVGANVEPTRPQNSALLAITRLTSWHDVEDATAAATDLLGEQVPALALWGDATHMAISELCDNAIQHGNSDLGAYVAADRVDDPQPCFRLVVADLGIGIPEHIRAHHPEWQNDTAAITRALERGVTGTGDPHRGNGIAEVLDLGQAAQVRRAMSELRVDIRSAKGRVGVRLVDGRVLPEALPTEPRRGTWVTYEVRTVC